MVHIREYEVINDSKMYPTKKGVCFTKPRWATFINQLDDIDKVVELLKSGQPANYFEHIGGRYYVSISQGFKCVNIRRYFKPSDGGKECPTRSGIALRLCEWDMLTSKIHDLHDTLPELKDAVPCSANDDHLNQMGYFSCRECNPFALHIDLTK